MPLRPSDYWTINKDIHDAKGKNNLPSGNKVK